mmetsp:Transcript_21189/g.27294  ORF Transcript_21189/g.27294 Transcript_21189/m.27294 type:complete len:811 (-) Transcript_21189:225-2657(-)
MTPITPKDMCDDSSSSSSSNDEDFDFSNWTNAPAIWEIPDEKADNGENDEDQMFHDADGERFNAEHLLILIDCRKEMFTKCVHVSRDDDDEKVSVMNHSNENPAASSPATGESQHKVAMITPFDATLMAVEDLLRQRVRFVATTKSGKRDGVGVLLYNTGKGMKQKRKTMRDFHRNMSDKERAVESDGDESASSSSEESSVLSDEFGMVNTSTHELIALAPPGVPEVMKIQRCLPKNRGEPRYSQTESQYHSYQFSGSSFDNDLKEDSRERNLMEEFANCDDEGNNSSVVCSLRTALMTSGNIFNTAPCIKPTSKNISDLKTIWIFTNEDDPCSGNEEKKKQIKAYTKDAAENGVNIIVWSMPKLEDGSYKPFDRSLLFGEISARGVDSDDHICLSGGKYNVDQMIAQIRRQSRALRRSCTLPLLFPGWENKKDVGIQLDLYRLVSIKARPRAGVIVHKETTNPLSTKTQHYTDRGDIVDLDDTSTQRRVKTFMNFGEYNVPITRKEIDWIKTMSNSSKIGASLLLMGFKRNLPPFEHMTGISYFAYPNDQIIVGSDAAFEALLLSMYRLGVFAVAELLIKVNSVSSLVAIIPQLEKREHVDYGNGLSRIEQIDPSGFIIIPLPFEDDIRRCPELTKHEKNVEEDVITAMKSVIKGAQIQGGIDWEHSFHNPFLKKFWNYLESIALGLRYDEPIDELQQAEDDVKDAVIHQIETLSQSLPDDDDNENRPRAMKRKHITVDNSALDWQMLYEDNMIAECTLKQLQSYLRSVGEKVSGKKHELVDRVTENIQRNKVRIKTESPPHFKMEADV